MNFIPTADRSEMRSGRYVHAVMDYVALLDQEVLLPYSRALAASVFRLVGSEAQVRLVSKASLPKSCRQIGMERAYKVKPATDSVLVQTSIRSTTLASGGPLRTRKNHQPDLVNYRPGYSKRHSVR